MASGADSARDGPTVDEDRGFGRQWASLNFRSWSERKGGFLIERGDKQTFIVEGVRLLSTQSGRSTVTALGSPQSPAPCSI
jgi:hypothetical protein